MGKVRLFAALSAVVLVLGGCDQQSPQAIGRADVSAGYGSLRVTHDETHQVTCWSVGNAGNATLSCLPDWMLVAPRGGNLVHQ